MISIILDTINIRYVLANCGPLSLGSTESRHLCTKASMFFEILEVFGH